MYSPWTDGKVNGWVVGSGGEGAATGHATIIGDDPLKLICRPTRASSRAVRAPMKAAIPAAAWSTTASGITAPIACIPQGGEIRDGITTTGRGSARSSASAGPPTTARPGRRRPARRRSRCLASPRLKGEPVKIGAPHFVDFGKNMEHSPDGKAYLAGHGASVGPEAAASPISVGSPATKFTSPGDAEHREHERRSKYEFFAGHDASGKPRWTRDFAKIKPLAAWNDNMGCVTMTYNAPLKKYLMCVTDGGQRWLV